MKFVLIAAVFILFSGITNADPKQRMIEIEMKPLGEASSRALPIVRFPVVEEFSGWIREKSQLSAYESFIQKMVKTYSDASNVDELANLWDSRSFTEIQKMLSSDAKIFDQNSSYYKRIQNSRVLGVVIYGNYEIIFVSHKLTDDESRNRYYPVWVRDDSRVLSNEIGNDVFFQYIINKLQDDLFERWSM